MPTTKTTTLGHRSHSRWSRRENQGSKVMNLHPMLLPMMQLSIFFHSDAFWTGSEVLDLTACPIFLGCSMDSKRGPHLSSDVRGMPLEKKIEESG
jgi:hypothetical protein